MKQVKITATLKVPNSLGYEIKNKGIEFKFENGKYIAKIDGMVISSRDADIEVKITNHTRK